MGEQVERKGRQRNEGDIKRNTTQTYNSYTENERIHALFKKISPIKRTLKPDLKRRGQILLG
jgi:hypothetical protein